METVKIFENNTYSKTCEAVVTMVKEEHTCSSDDEQMYLVVFDQTVFFPEGGGQSSDTGYARSKVMPEHVFKVTHAEKKDGLVYHTLAASPSSDGQMPKTPEPGDVMTLTIDWAHRFDNMQRHLGEHIVSGVFFRRYGAANKGFHMGDDYMTIDFAFPEGADPDRVTWEMAKEAELEANRIIWEDVPVIRSHFDKREEAEKMPLRKPLAFDSDISIITVGGEYPDTPEGEESGALIPKDPYDCVACCGTHPSSTGQVGIIKILKIEPNKGMSRVYMEAGERAYKILRDGFDDLYDIALDLSAGTGDVREKFLAQKERTDEEHNDLYKYRKKVLADEAKELAGMIQGISMRASKIGGGRSVLMTKEYEDRSADEVLNLIKELTNVTGPQPNVLMAFVSVPDNTVILRSDTEDCGKIIKENAALFSGKGGGKPVLARAMFPGPDEVSAFLEKIGTLV